ncbi:MAG: hypothetical protein IIA07_06920 [Proteobacteria bacterium]|nr:hypothetical protein [Pseudomonadota bacterium]
MKRTEVVDDLNILFFTSGKEDIPAIIEELRRLPQPVTVPPAQTEEITVETDESQDSTPH